MPSVFFLPGPELSTFLASLEFDEFPTATAKNRIERVFNDRYRAEFMLAKKHPPYPE